MRHLYFWYFPSTSTSQSAQLNHWRIQDFPDDYPDTELDSVLSKYWFDLEQPGSFLTEEEILVKEIAIGMKTQNIVKIGSRFLYHGRMMLLLFEIFQSEERKRYLTAVSR